MRGRPERGLPAVEIACRLNPRHPPWYNVFRARLLFQLGNYSGAAALLENRIWDVPARHLRDLGWRVPAYAHHRRLRQANRWAGELAAHGGGDRGAGAPAYIDWIVWASLLEQAADRERLRAGLRLAGLPA